MTSTETAPAAPLAAAPAAPAAPAAAALEAVLSPIVPALERLRDAQLEQRRQVVAGDLAGIVAVNATIEAASARIASLEQRRQDVQSALEAELGVRGLRAVLRTAAVSPDDRARLGSLLVQVSRLVRELREDGRQNAELLDAAMELARRTRLVLSRGSGTEATYDEVRARRQQATRQGRPPVDVAAAPVPAPQAPAPGEAPAGPAPSTEAP